MGFESDKSISKDTVYTSSVSAFLSNRLKDIHVHCSLVDSDKLFSYNQDGVYFSSSLILVLSIDTTQPLNGNFTTYNVDGMSIPCKNHSGQDIEFIVESGGHRDDYEIYLTLEINVLP